MEEMSLKKHLAEFHRVADRPYEAVQMWRKEHGGKVMGCSPMHFPEEMIHAAGMLPVVLQESDDPVTEGFSHVHPFFCGITRNVIDLAAKGALTFFDGLVYTNICIQNANAALTLKQMLKGTPVWYAQMPGFLKPNSQIVLD